MKDEDKLIAEIGEAEAREEIARLQMAFDTCTDIDPNPDSIDSLMATKVMCWQYIDRKRVGWGDGPVVWLTQSAYSPTFRGFSPSTDISHAMRVLEKLRETHTVCIKCRDQFRVVLFSAIRLASISTEDTLSLAICKAALAAIASPARPAREHQEAKS